MPAVLIEDVHKRFGSLEVLKGVSLSVETGQVVAIIGRSGSGKSTLLRCINGLETFHAGKIEVAGHTTTQDPTKLVYPVWRDQDVLDTWFSSALWP